MKPSLLLVDLQEDFLAEPGLEPHRATVAAGAVNLLRACRQLDMPVCHVWTTVHREPDDRMRHWKITGRWSCLEGTAGHKTALGLEPLPGEAVFHKTGFSAFANPGVAEFLGERGVDFVIVAGVHTHACVRQAALGAWERGIEVWIAADAVASHEPLDAAQTERYLSRRGIPFLGTRVILDRLEGKASAAGRDVEEVPSMAIPGGEGAGGARREYVHFSPCDGEAALWRCACASAGQVDEAVRFARLAGADGWSMRDRTEWLERAAGILRQRSQVLASQLTVDVGKPVRQARDEVERAAGLFEAVARRAASERLREEEPEASVLCRPHGVVAMVTPWNNPLAIPAGQFAPAFAFGNAVVWKPALPGLRIALGFRRLLLDAGFPPGCLGIVGGDEQTGLDLIEHPGIDAVCFTGSTANGWKVLHACSSGRKPLQAELGGNNGAVVFPPLDDLVEFACRMAESAFGFAGQRCTATRRVIVLEEMYSRAVALLERFAASLAWGPPDREETRIGPLLSAARVERVAGYVERAKANGWPVIQPGMESRGGVPAKGAYYPPTLVLCDDPAAEIVQEETFGPVLVVQRARDWEHAMELLNGVRHGLVASLFCGDPRLQERFADEAKAGILKINEPAAGAGLDVPFAGWKASGVGTPQHGICNKEFYTRYQTIYTLPRPAKL